MNFEKVNLLRKLVSFLTQKNGPAQGFFYLNRNIQYGQNHYPIPRSEFQDENRVFESLTTLGALDIADYIIYISFNSPVFNYRQF
jgi:hypothetical protein